MLHNLKRSFASAPTRSMIATASVLFLLVTCSLGFSQELARTKPTEDLPTGPIAARATTSCLECHEARIILQQRLSKANWAKEVDKMVRWGALADAGDRDALIDYLSTNFSPDKPPYDPPRTSTEKKEKR